MKFKPIPALILTLIHLLTPDATAQNGQSTFHRSDALRLTIWQPWQIGNGKNHNIDINGDYAIDSQGNAFFPLIGDVSIMGHTRSTLAAELKEKFSPYIQEPIVIVEPLIRVTMLGSFRRPGTYLVSASASLWQLVDIAGGPRDDSNLSKMSVERGGKVIRRNLLGGFEKGYTLREIGINSGDQVLVPKKKSFRVRDALEILRFGVSLINLYFLVQKF
ncbi:polysaccharide biosynthesis/export family protein [bacterium]|nr:polysaccharide biosynthesis/export family protein [bacterium]